MLSTLTSSLFSTASKIDEPQSNAVIEKSEAKLPYTLPGSWYTSESILELAKTKIFERNWHYLTLINSYSCTEKYNRTPDTFVQYNFYKNPFFCLVDVVDPYNPTDLNMYYGEYKEIMDGANTKEEIYSRLKTLRKVNHVITDQGMIFVNHEETPRQTLWEFYGNELQQFVEGKDFRTKQLRRRMVYENEYSFLTFLDGYQECLHCTYTHPSFSKVYPLEFYKVEPFTNFCRQYGKPSTDTAVEGLFIYFFATCAFNSYGGGIGLFRINPVNANRVRTEFDYFFDGSEEEFEKYIAFARTVAEEDIELCELTQKNLKTGIYRKGILNPDKENGVIFYQNLVREKLLEEI